MKQDNIRSTTWCWAINVLFFISSLFSLIFSSPTIRLRSSICKQLQGVISVASLEIKRLVEGRYNTAQQPKRTWNESIFHYKYFSRWKWCRIPFFGSTSGFRVIMWNVFVYLPLLNDWYCCQRCVPRHAPQINENVLHDYSKAWRDSKKRNTASFSAWKVLIVKYALVPGSFQKFEIVV